MARGIARMERSEGGGKVKIDPLIAALGVLGDYEIDLEAPDAFDKFCDETPLRAAFGRNGDAHVHDLVLESAPLNARVDAHYKKLAKEAATKEPAGDDPHKLEKRFSSPDNKAGYREYFREQIAKGQTANQALDEWFEQFPFRNPAVEKLMRETCTEFGGGN